MRRALAEDRAREDITTALLGAAAGQRSTGVFRAEEPLVIAGLPVAELVFRELEPGCRFESLAQEGERVETGRLIARVEARAATLLAGERVALNFLQRLCGIATETRRAVEAVRGTGAVITDTRKTTPGLRELEKYAVRVGGGVNHRHSLADGILWKDNHWVLLEASGMTLAQALASAPPGVPVVVEVEDEVQLEQAIAAGAKRLLVDNQPPDRVAEWVQRLGPGIEVEASGGITPETASAYAKAGARFISIGALTHSAPAAEIAFEIAVGGDPSS
ncbi:MAG: nicotinate-nucleotide diphosphorylase (carboxylating) [Gemmatimonadales bacterium]|nr:putative nicotinate-nucleotide pyrophosphorylase [carboxylating] [bacterium HR33]GIW52667.1 MAG: nicotinate-nucleotide diphosphorylase (carboxylating) [Gemmatimonadales bacterium]